MGLDSVELIMDWEDFFQIKIPDSEAVKMKTVADAVIYISSQVEYVDRGLDIKGRVFNELNRAFNELSLTISLDDLIFKTATTAEQALWAEISRKLKYELPLPFSSSTIGKWFDKLFPAEANNENVTVDRYVDLICSVNYQTLIQQAVQNQYEVMIAVMGMTIEKTGVSPFEVHWTSSFVNDLGID